jgi:hypothetical protein
MVDLLDLRAARRAPPHDQHHGEPTDDDLF